MRILQSWLKEYITFKIPPTQLADRLTMLGLEFEGVERLGEKYEGFVVGKVTQVSPHPNADRLSVCDVNIGKETLKVVCGAPNVSRGQKVGVGKVGATVPRNQHDPDGKAFVLSRVSIRGVESSGMICSEYELDLGKDAEGIMVLDPSARVGQPLADYLGLDDVGFDIEVTPNRPDWLSHIGVAREIGVLVGRKPKLPTVRLRESTIPIRKFLTVNVDDPENCPRFAARMIRGVHIGPSPQWLQKALRGVGLRPHNNVVDISNYVMLESGHPMHAFDYRLLRGGRIRVRQATPGTRFVTLDEKAHTLPEGAVMVCDGEREVAIAGIMGGANSEITNETTDVVLEAAYWNPSSIRRTAKSLGISTDASQRFERGADPNGPTYALNRAAQLILESAGGTLLKGMIDVYPNKVRPRKIRLRPKRVNALLGTDLARAKIVSCLRLLDIKAVGGGKDDLLCTVPTYRIDIEQEIDLIEEVARVHGYDRIEDKTSAGIDFAHGLTSSEVADRVRENLVGSGFHEAVSNPMVEGKLAQLEERTPVRILNPQNTDMAFLRTSLLPGLLDAVRRNQSHGITTVRFFEIGHVFSVDSGGNGSFVEGFVEQERVCFVLAGLSAPHHWDREGRNVDIFDLKGEVASFLRKIGLDKWRLISYSNSNGLTDNSLAVEIEGSTVGYLGRVGDRSRDLFDIKEDVFVAEFDLALLDRRATKRYVSLPRYPKVKRDVAFVVDRGLSAGDLEQLIRESCAELLYSVELFDVYEGDAVGEDKKSIAYSLEFMSRERTLTDQEIEAAMKQTVRTVRERLGAELRGTR
ncbi:MAG: phenylalanine--tRNA ligase subunit beta [Bacteroidota bacterium]